MLWRLQKMQEYWWYVEAFCTKSLMLWRLQKMQEYWWYVEAFCKCPQRKELVQITGENHSI